MIYWGRQLMFFFPQGGGAGLNLPGWAAQLEPMYGKRWGRGYRSYVELASLDMTIYIYSVWIYLIYGT